MLLAFTITIISILLTFSWHYYGLSSLRTLMPGPDTEHHHFSRSIGILFLLVMLHIAEILWFTLMFYLADQHLELGYFTGQFEPIFRNYFYFATVTYTTLGLAEFSPVGHLKVITGLTSLNGFILLTWSASFFFTVLNQNRDSSD